MKYPIYKNDGKAILKLSQSQKNTLKLFRAKIDNGEYKLVENKCLCKNNNAIQDIVIAEKDRYGIPIENILCSKCGLIRSGKVLDDESNIDFYKKYYRSIYGGYNNLGANELFLNQISRGQKFLHLFEDKVPGTDVSNIFEIGCGAGGIVYSFTEAGYEGRGCDYNQEYLNYGKSQGLDLLVGDYQGLVEDDSVDLLILAHVMEHFIDPTTEMNRIIKKVKPEGFLIIEVPGVFWIEKMYPSPLHYFQSAHVMNYYKEFLEFYYKSLGLDIIYGDQKCTFILQKPQDWTQAEIEEVFDQSLVEYPNKIKSYLEQAHYKHILFLSPYQWKLQLIRLLEYCGLKDIIKKLMFDKNDST